MGRGGAGRGGAGRCAGYNVAQFVVLADCGPSYCGAGCMPGDYQYMLGGADCGLNYNLRGDMRAQISSLRRALIQMVFS